MSSAGRRAMPSRGAMSYLTFLVCTAELGGQPTIVFAARDQVHALGFLSDRYLRKKLLMLRQPCGKPLWLPGADLMMWPATLAERAYWEVSLEGDLDKGVYEGLTDAISSNAFAFLVPYEDPEL